MTTSGHEGAMPAAEATFPLLQGAEAPLVRTDAEQARIREMICDHGDFTWRALRRLGLPAHVCDDATQRVFLVAIRRLDDIAVGSERGFLFKTAERVACSEKRSLVRRREVPDTGEELDPTPSPDQLLDQRRARDLLEQVLDQMSMDRRTVFVLFELEGMTIAEIAAMTGLPQGTVGSRLRRARADFEAALKRYQAATSRKGGAS